MRGHCEQQEGVGSRWKERPLRTIDHQNLHGEYEEREEEQKRMNVGCVNFFREMIRRDRYEGAEPFKQR